MFKYILLLSFLILSLKKSEGCAIPFTTKTHVYVGIDVGGPPLTIHCVSKDDDLGSRNLTRHQEYTFSFCPIPYDTWFSCEFRWSGKDKIITVYDANPFKKYCANIKRCYFLVKSDGFYLSDTYPPVKFSRVETWWVSSVGMMLPFQLMDLSPSDLKSMCTCMNVYLLYLQEK